MRIPDDNREYPLPPGLGRFPLAHVDNRAGETPASWRERGGAFLPMYQSEALWINFSCDYPCAIKIAAGKINAVTGEPWRNELSNQPQDYVVAPDQPWLDGFCIAKGKIRQFVAMPLGQGYTAEEQLTGSAEHGGIQIIAYPMKRGKYEEIKKRELHFDYQIDFFRSFSRVEEMGLAPDGLMRQKIYEDTHGFDAWDKTQLSRCFVHIVTAPSISRLRATSRHCSHKRQTVHKNRAAMVRLLFCQNEGPGGWGNISRTRWHCRQRDQEKRTGAAR